MDLSSSETTTTMVRNKFVTERVEIARKLARQLKREYGKNVLAIGVMGSVARGKAEHYSDIDMEIIVKRHAADSYESRIIDNTYCSLTFATSREVVREITRPDPLLPEKLRTDGSVNCRELFLESRTYATDV